MTPRSFDTPGLNPHQEQERNDKSAPGNRKKATPMHREDSITKANVNVAVGWLAEPSLPGVTSPPLAAHIDPSYPSNRGIILVESIVESTVESHVESTKEQELEGTVERRQQEKAGNEHPCYLFTHWALILSLFTASIGSVVVVGFAAGLFPTEKSYDGSGDKVQEAGGGGHQHTHRGEGGSYDVEKRSEYYSSLFAFLDDDSAVTPYSVQASSLEWMAFEDVPINDISADRFWQRFALVVWYFEQGGPTLWGAVNVDQSAGWILHGAGIHECDWKGVDCDTNLLISGLRLGVGTGITMTGETLSTELGVLTGLNRLDLSDHRLQGIIPTEWRALTNLETLILSKNKLSSTVPTWIGDLKKLKTLALDGNFFSGILPESMTELKDLRSLQVQENFRLRGTNFADVVSELTQLEYLDISMTNMWGTIPDTNETATSYFGQALETFLARKVQLRGTIPTTISLWGNLKKLSIEEAPGLTGTIPTELGLMSKLEILQIAYAHNLEGSLPTELGLLTNLFTLDLTWSQREGTLPTEYSGLTNLVELRLRQNHGITGTVPSEYSQMTSLRHLYLEGTDIGGVIGPELCSLGLGMFEMDCDRTEEVICSCCTKCHHNP